MKFLEVQLVQQFFFASNVAVINLFAILRYITDNIPKTIFHKIFCLPTHLLQVKRKGVREKRKEPELND
jgi:hypothetical protein